MAKPKNPLLSLDAHGSLGGVLTFQERHQQAFVRKKPTPKQPNTLAQIYHRWDYQDYASLWHALSAAEKQQYESDARRSRITGFNLWMRVHLNTLPDLAGRWHLDELSGATAYDSSKNTNNGTILGTTPATGVIDSARNFDGLDDKIRCGTQVFADVTDEYTIEAFIKTTRAVHSILNITDSITGRYVSLNQRAFNPSKLLHESRDHPGNTYLSVSSISTLDDGLFRYIAAFRKPGTFGVQVDTEITTVPDARPGVFTHIGEFKIGEFKWDAWFLGVADEVRVYTRCLTDAERLRHAERRYPL